MPAPPKYEIKPVKGGYAIVKHNGDWVNDCSWKERKYAEKHLEMLIAMGWAR